MDDDNRDAWAHQMELERQQLVAECIKRLERALQEWHQTKDFQAMGLI